MNCTRCGSKIKKGNSFCPSCGNKIIFFSENEEIVENIWIKPLLISLAILAISYGGLLLSLLSSSLFAAVIFMLLFMIFIIISLLFAVFCILKSGAATRQKGKILGIAVAILMIVILVVLGSNMMKNMSYLENMMTSYSDPYQNSDSDPASDESEKQVPAEVEEEEDKEDNEPFISHSLFSTDISLVAEDLPKTINTYDYKGNIESTVRIDEVYYEYETKYTPILNITVSGTKTYDASSASSSFDMVSYKVYDSQGFVVKTSQLFIYSISAGDRFKEEINIYDVTPGETYRIVFDEYNL